MDLDNNAIKWLEEHKNELLLDKDGDWPIPAKIESFDNFNFVSTDFNKVISDQNNWKIILSKKNIYHQWIIPHAILLFGKTWFDKVKWQNSIQKGILFPLFSNIEKETARSSGIQLEHTNFGKSIIMRICSRVEHALDIYLFGGGIALNGQVKSIGGYIINSIKNEFIKEIAESSGYKLVKVPTCPLCAFNKNKKNKVLTEVKPGVYSCKECEEVYKNLSIENNIKNDIDQETKKQRDNSKLFIKFKGLTCVCPSDNCLGKFVPLNSVEDKSLLKTPYGKKINKIIDSLKSYRSIQKFYLPPKELYNLSLKCPYCDTIFTIKEALDNHSGFKNNSGMFTGVPSLSIWKKKDYLIHKRELTNYTIEDVSNFVNFTESVEYIQKAQILIDELLLQIYNKLHLKTTSFIITKYFYFAVIDWIYNHSYDASKYFFEDENINERINVKRGLDGSLHKIIFYSWIKNISNHILEIRKIDKGFKLNNLKWLSTPSEVEFITKVDKDRRIHLNSEIASNFRLAWVLSVKKYNKGKKHYNNIIACDWTSFMISKESELDVGDLVKVKILTMSNHKSHAPLKRISRIRTKQLFSIVKKIKEEEKTSQVDFNFWKKRKENVKKMRQNFYIAKHIKEFQWKL